MLEHIRGLLQTGADLDAPGDHGATLVRTGQGTQGVEGAAGMARTQEGWFALATHRRRQRVQRGSGPAAGAPGQPGRQGP